MTIKHNGDSMLGLDCDHQIEDLHAQLPVAFLIRSCLLSLLQSSIARHRLCAKADLLLTSIDVFGHYLMRL